MIRGTTFIKSSGAPTRIFQLTSFSCLLGLNHHHHQRQKPIDGQHQRPFAGSGAISVCSTLPLTTHDKIQPAHLQIEENKQLKRNINFIRPNQVSSLRSFSTITKGQDLLADSLAHGGARKIILDSYYPKAGIEVLGMIEHKDDDELTMHSDHDGDRSARGADVAVASLMRNNNTAADGEDDKPQNLLMNSSVIAFPNSCFLWKNVSKPKDVTLESLSIVQLLKPPIENLFIGSDEALPPRELNRIKKEMKKRSGIVVEQMDVMNAMGTFNILNGEDRRIAVALVVDVQNEEQL